MIGITGTNKEIRPNFSPYEKGETSSEGKKSSLITKPGGYLRA
jgi:hypothetical protein